MARGSIIGTIIAAAMMVATTGASASAKWDHAKRFETASLAHNARFLAVLAAAATGKDMLAKVGRLNRAVNLSISAMPDIIQYGVEDYWATPLETFESGRGDCEDYAIAKMAALEAIGVPSTLLVLRKGAARHAVVAVVIDGRRRILDNLTNAMTEAPRGEIIMELKREIQP